MRADAATERPAWVAVHWADFKARNPDLEHVYADKPWRRHEAAGTMGEQLAYSRLADSGVVLYVTLSGWRGLGPADIPTMLPLATEPPVGFEWSRAEVRLSDIQDPPLDPLKTAAERAQMAMEKLLPAIRECRALGLIVTLCVDLAGELSLRITVSEHKL